MGLPFWTISFLPFRMSAICCTSVGLNCALMTLLASLGLPIAIWPPCGDVWQVTGCGTVWSLPSIVSLAEALPVDWHVSPEHCLVPLEQPVIPATTMAAPATAT